MTRPLPWLAILLLSGCSEAEPTRFVPASTDAPKVSREEWQWTGKAASQTTVPKNIPMH